MQGTNIEVDVKEDGIWLTFRASNGNLATLRVETLVHDRGPIVRQTILQWCQDQRTARVGPAIPTGVLR